MSAINFNNYVVIKEIKEDFKKQDIDKISFSKSVNNYEKYALPIKHYIDKGSLFYKSGTPIHVKASMNYNYLITKNNLSYMDIGNATKIKYVFVKPKNKIKAEVLAYIGKWPKEFNKWIEIDYDLQFDKGFLVGILF